MAGINFYTIKTNDKLLNTNDQYVIARSFLFCHCEEPPFFVIARSEATKQSHPIMLEELIEDIRLIVKS